MAHVKTNAAGTRYTGYFRVDGVRLSAGTYDSREEALSKAQEAERHGTKDYPPIMTVEAYAEQYLRETPHLTERTKQGYRSLFRRLINPVLGQRLVGELTRREVRRFLDDLANTGAGMATVNQCKCAIGSMYKDLVRDDMILVSPTSHLPNYSNPPAQFEVVELDEFKAVREKLPTEGAKLFADFLIALGLRFGEATEARVKDLTTRRGVTSLMVSRAVSDVGAVNNNGTRFVVLRGTKGASGRRKVRSVSMPKVFAQRLQDWIEANNLSEDDLLFPVALVEPVSRKARVNTTGHLPRDRWRRIWRKAIKASKIGWYPRTHDLRHACASHMLEAGASVQEVKDMLGHGSITTTAKYLHTLSKQRETTPFDTIWSETA